MELAVKGGNVALKDEVFAASFNEALVHQAVTAYLAGARAGTKRQKNRSEVSGGGIKPWRQKGTGRARAGTIRSPIWQGGGQTFAARPRNFQQKLNQKMYRAAMRSILSELVRESRLLVADISLDEPKTKGLVSMLEGLEAGTHALIVVHEADRNLELAARNIPHVECVSVNEINPVNLIAHEKVILSQKAVNAIEEWLA